MTRLLLTLIQENDQLTSTTKHAEKVEFVKDIVI
jgi:hypothetical protein